MFIWNLFSKNNTKKNWIWHFFYCDKILIIKKNGIKKIKKKLKLKLKKKKKKK